MAKAKDESTPAADAAADQPTDETPAEAPASNEVPVQEQETPAEDAAPAEDPQEPAADPAPAPEAPAASDSADLDAREASIKEREDAANATLAKAEEVAAQVQESLRTAQDATSALMAQGSEASIAASHAEKAAVVSELLQGAHGDANLGEMVKFTPMVTLSNNTKVGLVTFEKGVEYTIPEVIKQDLEARQATALTYQENLHVREEVSLNAGNISGGGK